ncbi:50S ribosomal protein L1 [Patescibacteria group bacterium]
MKRGKNYKAQQETFGSESMSISDAIVAVKDNSKEKFDATIEVHIKLGIDPKQSDQMVRGNVNLGGGIAKEQRIAVFADDAAAKAAKDAGATLIGGEELIKEIGSSGKIDFDIAIATPDMMPKLAKIAKVLGPRGLMPNPKNDTVTPEPAKAIAELSGGKTSFKMDSQGNIHQVIGRVSFDPKQIEENYTALIDAIKKAKPEGQKGEYLKTISISSTMGPSIKVSK